MEENEQNNDQNAPPEEKKEPPVSHDEVKIIVSKAEESEEEETEINKDGFFSETNNSGSCSVRVALRVRPLIAHELQNGKICVQCMPSENQVIIGKDRSFTFDKVFGIDSPQQPIFETCVKNLVLGCFHGFNATVLAYGQTGSGKTFTMGSGHTIGLNEDQFGIIPRVITFIFDEISKRSKKAEFIVKCSFLEIYNEEIHDLLDSSAEAGVDRYLSKGKDITIREEKSGNISVYGLQEEKVKDSEELASCLDRGSNLRITSSTLMNNCSSRSHAIFTIMIEQHVVEDLYQNGENGAPDREANEIDEFMTAKFHFVDLAGSERAKKTGATGNTLKEGININKGLLSLGNVISALTEDKSKVLHVPYRDSKLTRILQDSLGGNSRTSMIACISPAEFNFDESLNTLKYASRARNIKNKPIVNRDPNSALIAQLRQQLFDLQNDMMGFKKLLVENNIDLPEETSDLAKNLESPRQNISTPTKSPSKFGYFGDKDTEDENKKLKQELKTSQLKIGKLETEIKSLREQLDDSEIEKGEVLREKDLLAIKLETLTQICQRKGVNIQEEYKLIKEERKKSKPEGEGEDNGEGESDSEEDLDLADTGSLSIITQYRVKNEQLKKEMQDKEVKFKLIQNECESLLKISKEDTDRLEEKAKEIQRLKRTNNKLQKENVTLKREKRNAGKPGADRFDAAPKLTKRNTLYIPSTQKLGLSKKRKQSNDLSLDKFEPDEDKIDEIENNIFSKITESVDKIFNTNLDSRSTFTGYKMMSNELDAGDDTPYRMTIAQKSPRKASIEDKFAEIAEMPEEEEKDRASTTKGNEDRSTTFFFDGESSKSNSEEEGDPSKGPSPQKHEDEQDLENKQAELIEEINTLQKEVEEEEKQQVPESEGDTEAPDDLEKDESIDPENLDSHFEQVATEEDKKEDQNIQQELFGREQEVDSLDTQLQQKQEILDAIVESNKEMKKSIVDTMKQEYLKKIIALQNEIKRLESQKERDLSKAKNEASKNSVSSEYRKKIKDMEKELKNLKKKDKEQVDKLRTSKKQKEKIQLLNNEIETMKAQKVKLMRQIKEEKDRYRKWKDEKTKSLIRMKRSNLKKDQEIQKLKKDNSRKAHILRRKMEELKALQKRQKNDALKHRKALAQKRKLKRIDPEKIKKWVKENTQKLMKYQDIKEEMDKETKAQKATEQEIEEEQNQFAMIQTKKEKLEAKRRLVDPEDRDEIEDIDTELRGYELELNNINENMNSLEDKLEFINEKISVFNKEIIEINPEGIECLRFEEITNLEEAKIYLGSFFNIFLEMNVYRSMIENKILEQDEVIDKLNEEIKELSQKLQASEIKFREELNQMEKKYKQKQDYIKSEINEFMKLDLLANTKEQELQDVLASNSPVRIKKEQSATDLGVKNPKQLREEIQQRKNALREVARVQASSKIGLSKLVTSLEKQTIEDEKKIEILNHKLNHAAKEKQMFKQKYETLKAKVKNNETDDIKLIKTISLETREKYAKSPFGGSSKARDELKPSGLKSLTQARKERKKAPAYTTRTNSGPFEKSENRNKTPQRSKKVEKDSLAFEYDDSERKKINRNSFISSNIVTTAAPKPPAYHKANKSTSNIGGLVKDESKNTK